MSFGLTGFGRMGLVTRKAGSGTLLTAPTLTLTSGTTDNTPDFNITFPDILVVGTVVTIQYGTDPFFSGATSIDHTVTTLEAANSLVILSVPPLSLGTYYFRAKYAGSNWSNTVTETIVAPSGFSPSSFGTDLKLWLEADDLTTLYQSSSKSNVVTTDGQSVGYWTDKSVTQFDMASVADNSTRPLWHTSGGLSWVEADGVNDILSRSVNIWGSGLPAACSVFVAVRASSPTANTALFHQSNDNPVTVNQFADYINVDGSVTTTANARIRNDAGSFQVNTTNLQCTGVFDGTDRVYGVTDDGSTLSTYNNGVAGGTFGYTRSGVYTFDMTKLFGFVRNGPESWFAGRLYSIVVVQRMLTPTERSNLVTYLQAKITTPSSNRLMWSTSQVLWGSPDHLTWV